MSKKILLLVFILLFLSLNSASARDTRHMFLYSDVIAMGMEKGKLDGSIKFYFGKQTHPAVEKDFGEFMSNRKTNAFNKSDKGACEWALLSALLSLQKRAKNEGGDAVINIKSYYKKNLIESNTEFECGAGGIIAGVTLKGTVVKLK